MKFETFEHAGDYSVASVRNARGHEGEPCPYGSLRWRGKKVADFAFDTWGGPETVDFGKNKAAKMLFEEHLASLPLVEFDAGHETYMMEWSAGMFLDELIKDFELIQGVKRRKTKTCFQAEGDERGDLRWVNAPWTEANKSKIRSYLDSKYGVDKYIILNEVIK